jgi:high-affinity K+ transport system ATPase subunit B
MSALNHEYDQLNHLNHHRSQLRHASVSPIWYQNQEAKRVLLRDEAAVRVVFLPTHGSLEELYLAAFLSSIGSHTPFGNAIFAASLSEKGGEMLVPKGSRVISDELHPGFSGIDLKDSSLRMGSVDRIESWLNDAGKQIPIQVRRVVSQAERRGHSTMVVANQDVDLGVVELFAD